MSTIRLAESLFTDPRFLDLVKTLLDDDSLDLKMHEYTELAIGKCVRAMFLAQRYWRDDRALIPLEIWNARSNQTFASLLPAVGLAEIRPPLGVYLRGSQTHFDWYHDKVEAGRLGGIKSGKVRASKSSSEADEAVLRSNEPVPIPTPSLIPPPTPPKTDKLNTPKSAPKPEAPQDIELADSWAQFAVEVSKTVKPDIPKWAATVRLLREKNGFTHDELRQLLAFARDDDFWRVNVASLPALRQRSKNGLLKAENLKAAALKKDGGDFEDVEVRLARGLAAAEERRRTENG